MPEPSPRERSRLAPLYLLAGLVAPTRHSHAASRTAMHTTPPTPELAELAELQLRALNHRFIHEALDPTGALLEAATADNFLHTAADGQWHERAAHIAQRRRHPPPGEARIEGQHVRRFGAGGGVAIVHGLFIAPHAGEAPLRIRFTDVYRWHGDAWQLVAAQDTALREGVAATMNRGAAPTIPPWTGADPADADGDEHALLVALNEHYVRAFRECDIAWYDAHLTPDYFVISGDGSMNDRATALTNFARPVFATSMRSFPVGRVQVRRFDDVALIHAENDYELNDGRRGVSRYTDIWVKSDAGRWRCLAAHITVHRAPA